MFKLAIIALLFVAAPVNASANALEQYIAKNPLAAPTIEFEDASGTIHSLNMFEGKVILLNFWATWCAPCVQEMPALSQLQSELANHNVLVLPLSLDGKGAQTVNDFYQNTQINNLPTYLDKNHSAYRAFGVRALPTSFIINKTGQVVAMIPGFYDWHEPQMKNYIISLAKEKG